MSEAESGGTATEPGADVGALITSLADNKDLATWLADTDVAGLVVDWLVEETSLPRAVVRPSVILVARLIAGSARSGAGWLGKRAAKSSIWLLRQLPYGLECVEALGRLRGRFDSEIAAKREFKDILAGKRPAREASKGDHLPFDLQADLRLLQDTEELSAGIDEILARLNPQPALRLDLLERSHAARMQYGAQWTPMVGRDAELERLAAFLDDDRPFLWWLVVAAGGAGKSRLALELCQRRGVAWRAGFLVMEASFAWSTWRPECPTLIVVDYVTPDKAERLQGIIQQLRAPTEPFNYPVRLLLLERDGEDSPWYEKLVPAGNQGQAIAQFRFDAPLTLPPLDGAAVRAVQEAMTEGAAPADAVERLDEVDPERRPLFAMLTAEAAGAGDREQIVRDYLRREDEHYWQPHGVTDADRNLLALATMIGGNGLPVKDAVAIDPGGLLPDARSYDPERLRRMTGRDARDFVPPLQPDLLGDLFVLDTLERRHGADDRLARFHAWAWSLSPGGMFGLLSRVSRDYPRHPSLERLFAPPPGGGDAVRRLWAAAVVFIIQDCENTTCDVPFARALWDKLAALTIHPDEARLRKMQALGASKLVQYYCDGVYLDLQGARDLWDWLAKLAAAHADEPNLREKLAMFAHSLIAGYGRTNNLPAAHAIFEEVTDPNVPLERAEQQRAKGIVFAMISLIDLTCYPSEYGGWERQDDARLVAFRNAFDEFWPTLDPTPPDDALPTLIDLTAGLERLHEAARPVPEIAEIIARVLRVFRAAPPA